MSVERATVSVEEMAVMLGISRPKGYALAHTEGFPAIRVGRRIRVPVDGLKRWLEENEGKQVLR